MSEGFSSEKRQHILITLSLVVGEAFSLGPFVTFPEDEKKKRNQMKNVDGTFFL